MKPRFLINTIFFASIMLCSFSLTSLIITFTVKDDQVFTPVSKNYFENQSKKPRKPKKLIYFGKQKKIVTQNNIFDSEKRVLNPVITQNAIDEANEAIKKQEENVAFYLENPESCKKMKNYELSGTALAYPKTESTVTILETNRKRTRRIGRRGRRRRRRRRRYRGRHSLESIQILTIGDTLDDNIEIAGVRRNLAVFKTTNGVRCLGEDVGKKEPTKKKNITPKRNSRRRRSKNEYDVRKIGKNAYALKRTDITKATTNLNHLARQARIIPSRKHNGFKIIGIKRNSIYKKIGIKNGDVIKSINGIDLSSPDKALEAYQRLRSANKLSMDVIRRGKKETMDYIIE